MLSNDQLNLIEDVALSAIDQGKHEQAQTLILISEIRERQELIDKWNEPKAAKAQTATEINSAMPADLNLRVKLDNLLSVALMRIQGAKELINV